MNLLLDIATEEHASNRDKAERCLREISRLPFDDLLTPELRVAAQTFSTLAVVDALVALQGEMRRIRT